MQKKHSGPWVALFNCQMYQNWNIGVSGKLRQSISESDIRVLAIQALRKDTQQPPTIALRFLIEKLLLFSYLFLTSFFQSRIPTDFYRIKLCCQSAKPSVQMFLFNAFFQPEHNGSKIRLPVLCHRPKAAKLDANAREVGEAAERVRGDDVRPLIHVHLMLVYGSIKQIIIYILDFLCYFFSICPSSNTCCRSAKALNSFKTTFVAISFPMARQSWKVSLLTLNGCV